nr:MAG TPA: hypothetical protein [Caudoviricetes sp.]
MCQIRDKNTQLSAQEIDAIKATQEIIKRMAENSQKTKTCFLATCAVFCAILGRGIVTLDWRICAAFLLLALAFWVMDARYLQLERQLREHHKAIVSGAIPSLETWDFSPARYRTTNLFFTMFSFSTWPYPAVAIAFLLIA